jgi:hypothetical protein
MPTRRARARIEGVKDDIPDSFGAPLEVQIRGEKQLFDEIVGLVNRHMKENALTSWSVQGVLWQALHWATHEMGEGRDTS